MRAEPPYAPAGPASWLRRRYRAARRWLSQRALERDTLRAAEQLDAPELDAPVFVIGCPRSGTTLLGDLLAGHPQVAYLNEPHWLWAGLMPCSDAWSRRNAPLARLELGADAAGERLARRARRAFAYVLRMRGGQRLVEKTPDNSARVVWLDALFPDARFVHLLRDPHATAISLAAALARWYPAGWAGTPQWSVWDRHCRSQEGLAETWRAAADDYERSLVVWREENRLASEAGAGLGSRYGTLRYESLVSAPRRTLGAVLDALGLAPDGACLDRSERRVRPAAAAPARDAERVRRFVGAPLLERLGYADAGGGN